MRPVRAAAPSPGHRPGFFMDANITPCKGKSFLNVFKAFALTGRFADYQHYPGRCPGLGAAALTGRMGTDYQYRSASSLFLNHIDDR